MTRKRRGLTDGLTTGMPQQTRRRMEPSDRNRREQAARHGLTVAELDALGTACAICGFTGPLVVDHDHEAAERHGHDPARGCRMCVRGLLCDYCNTGIAKLGDDPERMRIAAAYVEAGLLRTLRLEGAP